MAPNIGVDAFAHLSLCVCARECVRMCVIDLRIRTRVFAWPSGMTVFTFEAAFREMHQQLS